MLAPSPIRSLDIVVPVFNEAPGIPSFHSHLREVLEELPCPFRIVYVDDGSRDGTGDLLRALAAADSDVAVVELSRNFGHQAALTAGLSLADAEAVITMDGDGQHPPRLILEMVRLAGEGYDLILTERTGQAGAGPSKRWTSTLFYRFLNFIGDTKLTPGGADFRLMRAPVAEAIRQMPEYHRFLRGMVSWVGFRSATIPFSAPARMAGETKYSLRKMLQLAMHATFSFSLVPLYLAVMAGFLFLVMAGAEAIFVLFEWASGGSSQMAPGWASLMFVLLAAGGSILITSGLTGLYVGFIYQEVKRRPVFLIRSVIESRSRLRHGSDPEWAGGRQKPDRGTTRG